MDEITRPPDKRVRRKTRPTMNDVAQAAGVSQATVSLVLNGIGGTRVNEPTAEAVRTAARTLGYSLNRRAPVGRGGTQTIGYVIEDTFTNPMVNIAIEAARRTAWERDCVLLVLPTHGDSQLRSAALGVLLEQRLAGIIVSSFFTNEIKVPSVLRSCPTVLLNCYTARDSVPALLPGHMEGARHGVEYLIARGHRRIGMINGFSWIDAYRDRFAGYRQALEAAGIAFDPALVTEGEPTVPDGRRAAAALLDIEDPPTAIFAAADRIALGVYEEVKRRGLRIGKDIAVLGCDDDPLAQAADPPLSTIRIPHQELGERAVGHLLAVRDGSSEGAITGRVTVDAPLILRRSI